MTTGGWIAIGVMAVITVIFLIWGLLRYLRRLQVRMWCWMQQGRTIGVEGTIRNMFRRNCTFQWNCDCVDHLVGGEDTPGGRLMAAIQACSAQQSFRETLFDTMNDCTTLTIHTMAPGVGANPNRPLWLAFQLAGCRGRVLLSCQDALWFWWQLRMQTQQCCWT